MQIHEVMKETGMSKKAINYYEEKGLIQVKKSENGYRDYNEEAIAKLWQIKVLRKLDFSSADIEAMLDGKREEVFQSHFDTIDKRIAQCTTQKQYIKALYEQDESNHLELYQQIDQQLEEEFQFQNSFKVDIRKKHYGNYSPGYSVCIIIVSFAFIYQTTFALLNVFGFVMLIYGIVCFSLSLGPSSPMDLLIITCRDRIAQWFDRSKK